MGNKTQTSSSILPSSASHSSRPQNTQHANMSNFRESNRPSLSPTSAIFTQSHEAHSAPNHMKLDDTFFCEGELIKAGFESDSNSASHSTETTCSSLHSEASSISMTDIDTFEAEHKWSIRALSSKQIGTLTANLIIYHDLLSIWWRLIYARRDTLRNLLFSDYAQTLKSVDASVQLLGTLNSGDTADLYASYHATNELSDVKFVFTETNAIVNNERFFAFKSFSAQILFVCQKLEMLPFFDGTYTLPQRYADWKALYMHQMRLYLVHTLKVDDVSSHRIACSLANVVDCVQREHSIALLGKDISMLVNHRQPTDGCPVHCNVARSTKTTTCDKANRSSH